MKAKKDSLIERKLDWNLLLEDFHPALRAVCEVLDDAAYRPDGYGPRNWQHGDAEFCYHLRAAIGRHRDALHEGQTHDEKSGKPHRAHIVCGELMLMMLQGEL